MIVCMDGKISLKASVVVLGMFDGVHIGHQVLLRKAGMIARSENVPLVVQTFADHPMGLLDPENQPPLLTTFQERTKLMEAMGVDYYSAPPFTAAMRDMPPEEFVGRLVRRWKPVAVVVGYNYSFGREGAGTPLLLHALGDALGFRTVVVPAIRYDGKSVSASEVRRVLALGQVAYARKLLGRPYALNVVKTEGRNGTYRFAANEKQPVPANLYRVLAESDGRRVPALARVTGQGTVLCRLPEKMATVERFLFIAEQPAK